MEIEVLIENRNKVLECMEDYEARYPETYTNMRDIYRGIADTCRFHFQERDYECPDYEIQVPVCSDWEDKCYCFDALYLYSKTDDSIIVRVKFVGVKKC